MWMAAVLIVMFASPFALDPLSMETLANSGAAVWERFAIALLVANMAAGLALMLRVMALPRVPPPPTRLIVAALTWIAVAALMTSLVVAVAVARSGSYPITPVGSALLTLLAVCVMWKLIRI